MRPPKKDPEIVVAKNRQFYFKNNCDFDENGRRIGKCFKVKNNQDSVIWSVEHLVGAFFLSNDGIYLVHIEDPEYYDSFKICFYENGKIIGEHSLTEILMDSNKNESLLVNTNFLDSSFYFNSQEYTCKAFSKFNTIYTFNIRTGEIVDIEEDNFFRDVINQINPLLFISILINIILIICVVYLLRRRR